MEGNVGVTLNSETVLVSVIPGHVACHVQETPPKLAEVCIVDIRRLMSGSYAFNLYANPTASGIQAVSNGMAYQGCLQEVPGRALTGSSTVSDSMTVDICTSYCKGLNFKYAAVEYGRECYCGNSFNNGASVSLTSNQCTMTCASGTGLCGGPNALQLYM
jgi:hypothetical protein